MNDCKTCPENTKCKFLTEEPPYERLLEVKTLEGIKVCPNPRWVKETCLKGCPCYNTFMKRCAKQDFYTYNMATCERGVNNEEK